MALGANVGRASLAAVLAAWATVSAQTPVFRGGVETVEVTVTVSDGAGRLVTGLARDDFAIYEDGELQTITHFTDARVPVSLGVLLDISDSMRGQPMVDARAAVDLFVGEMLKPEDEVFLAVFNHNPRGVAPWTSPPGMLKGRLAGLLPNGATAIYDALKAVVPAFSQRTHTRSAILLVSDGADTASDLTLTEARTVLQQSDPLVYAIAVDSSPRLRASTRTNPESLQNITGPSGGYTEVIHSTADLGPAAERLAFELDHQYTIGYSPTRRPDGGWRAIRVRPLNREYGVRARRGYFAVPPEPGGGGHVVGGRQ